MFKLGQQTITGKFTILIALLLVFSMTFLSVVTYTSFSQMVDRKVVQLSENLLALANQNLDYIIADVKDTSNLLLTSSSIQQVLLYVGNDQKVLEYNKSLIEATNLMNNMVNNKTYLSSVYIGNPNLRLTSRKGDHFSLRISQLDYDNPPVWMQKILADKGQGSWFHGRTMVDFEGELLVYAREILNLYTLKELGIMLIALDVSTLDGIFEAVEANNHMNVFFWENDQLIYAFHQPGSVLDAGDDALRTAEGFVSLKGMRCYVHSLVNASSGWRISCAIPYQDFQQEKANIMRLVLLLTAGLVLAAVLLGYVITKRSITGTLHQLHRFVEAFRSTGSCDGFVFDRKDEVGQIGAEFIHVVGENERLIAKLYEARYREKESELIALQSQINPHFLYNTLDSIFWSAQEYGADNIARMTVALSNVFRMSLNRGSAFWKISDELQLVNNYLLVQNMRFDDRFQVEIHLDEALMDKQIIKLILQPIVENAVQHGLEKRCGKGIIRIIAEEEGDDLTFIIQDNGIGFQVDEENPLGNGYALHNVDRRIKLYYGPQFGVVIHSEPNVGTVVRVAIRREIPSFL